MRTLCIAALLGFMLMLTAASTGHAQSAEELAKGQNAGVSYAYLTEPDDSGVRWTNRVRLRGDEVSFTQYKGYGSEFEMSRCRVTNKRTEGNKLILETTPPLSNAGAGRITIDGNRLTSTPMFEGLVFTRE